MTSKTDDQVEKDKQAVAKMAGAKSAMEAALRRIECLEGALKRMEVLALELARMIGEDARVYTAYHNVAARGQFCSESKTAPVSTLVTQIKDVAAHYGK